MPKTATVNSNDDEDDKNKVVKDGESIRTSLLLMDSVQSQVSTRTVSQDALAIHKRGYVELTDAERARRQSLYAEYDRRLCDAWMTPSSDLAVVVNDAPKPQTIAERYAARDRALSEAWRDA